VKRKDRQAIVADALDRFQIVGKKDLYPNQLFGGQQQLVAVARANHRRAQGDPGRRADRQPALLAGRMIMDLLKDLNREGTTIIQVTHNEEYAKYGNRIIQLRDGWIVES
jgi:ABC-type lipoprotein export system ATPase subunit